MSTEIIPIKWNLTSIWNDVSYKEQRDQRERDYVYASEIGRPMYDRFLKMKAVPYTNPPTERSLRKFMAGNIWEHVVKQVFLAVGVFKKEEIKINNQPFDDLLGVHGRCDFICGGEINGDEARYMLSLITLPDVLFNIAIKMIDTLDGQFLEKKIYELKSVSTFAMDRLEKINQAIPNHTLQAYHYERGDKTMPAVVGYVCKDDCRMAEYPINSAVAEPLYHEDLKEITYYYRKNETPPKEPLLSWDPLQAKFVKNLGVEYSPYLSHYGFNTPDEYRAATKFITSWNNGLKRYAQCETGMRTPKGAAMKLTDRNIEIKKEIEQQGFDFVEILRTKIDFGVDQEEAETQE